MVALPKKKQTANLTIAPTEKYEELQEYDYDLSRESNPAENPDKIYEEQCFWVGTECIRENRNFISVSHYKMCNTIFLVFKKFTIFHKIFSNQGKWYEACLDTGTQTTVASYRQAKAYCNFMKTEFKLVKSGDKYKFGDDKESFLDVFWN